MHFAVISNAGPVWLILCCAVKRSAHHPACIPSRLLLQPAPPPANLLRTPPKGLPFSLFILPRTFIRSFVQLPSSLLLFHPSGKHWRRRAAGTSVVALQVSTSRQPRPFSALARTIHETNRHTQDTRTTRARRPTPSSAAPHSVSTKPTFQSRTPSFLNPGFPEPRLFRKSVSSPCASLSSETSTTPYRVTFKSSRYNPAPHPNKRRAPGPYCQSLRTPPGPYALRLIVLAVS